MRWLQKNTRHLLGLGFVVALFSSVVFVAQPVSAAHTSTTGEIQGGRYYAEVKPTGLDKASKWPFEDKDMYIDSKTTTVTLSPVASGSTIDINSGRVTVSNVPPGTYSVEIAFTVSSDLCKDISWLSLGGAPVAGACSLFATLPGATVSYHSVTKTFPSVLVKANEITYLEGKSDINTGRSIGKTYASDKFGNAKINCTGDWLAQYTLCPAAQALFSMMDFAFNQILAPALIINPLSTQSDLYKIWNNIRNLANIGFILAFFAIIFSQATSIGISNYGIKKLLPKLILVAVATNLSFFVCSFMIDATNIFGAGAASLITSAVNGKPTLNLGGLGIGQTIVTLLGVVVAFPVIVPALFIFIIIGAFIIFVAAFCALLRVVMVVFLVIMSPAAFLAWLFPGTEQMFRRWFTTFARLLIMYPLIMIIFGLSQVISTILTNIGGFTQ